MTHNLHSFLIKSIGQNLLIRNVSYVSDTRHAFHQEYWFYEVSHSLSHDTKSLYNPFTSCKSLMLNMKIRFLGMFLLIISCAQAISKEDFVETSTSADRSLIESNEQGHELNGTISLTFNQAQP